MAKANPLKKITARAKQIARATGKSWQQSIKQAGREYRGGKLGATLLLEKGETRRTKPARVVQISRTKAGTFKGSRQISGIPGAGNYSSMAEVKEANKKAGNYWFSPGTMKFFKTKISTPLISGAFFITRDPDMYGKDPRYTIRCALASGRITTLGDFRKYATLPAAKKALQEIINK